MCDPSEVMLQRTVSLLENRLGLEEYVYGFQTERVRCDPMHQSGLIRYK